MKKAIIVGASGYTGAELARYLTRHPHIELVGVYVSANSQDAGKPLSQLHGQLLDQVDLALQPLTTEQVAEVAEGVDLVLLATAHEVSHDLAPLFLDAGCKVFDLSGAFRVSQPGFYEQYYGFAHQHAAQLEGAVYGLAEWAQQAIAEAELVAVPGCYPTASLLALKPLHEAGLLSDDCVPVINATSGVSGAGRKASLTNSFCEVSLHPYGVFGHRHLPEISTHLGREVIFTPHLGNYVRGILATITVKLKADVTAAQVSQAYRSAYEAQPLVRLVPNGWPNIKNVAGSPFCDLHWQQQGQHLIVVSAIDNLLKGAASQAMQCVNLNYGYEQTCGLL